MIVNSQSHISDLLLLHLLSSPLELWGLSSKLETCDLASESEITKHSANDVPLWVIADYLPTCTYLGRHSMQCLPTVGYHLAQS